MAIIEKLDTDIRSELCEADAGLKISVSVENDVENNDGKINDLVEKGTAVYDEEGNKDTTTNTAEVYFEKLNRAVGKKIPNTLIKKENIEKSFAEADITDVESVCDLALESKKEIVSYFTECNDSIKRMKTSLSDSIIAIDKKKDFLANKDLSLVNGILMNGGKYLHPVAAMVQLARLKVKLSQAVKKEDADFADMLKKREIADVPAKFVSLDADFTGGEEDGGKNKMKFK